MKRRCFKWTRADDAALTEAWSEDVTTLALRFQRSRGSILCRGRKLKLPSHKATYRLRFEPSFAEWHQAARDEAALAGIPLVMVINPTRQGRPSRSNKPIPREVLTMARWRAWQRLKENPQYSLAGIGRVTGWHHTSIMHGLERLKELELPSLVLKG